MRFKKQKFDDIANKLYNINMNNIDEKSKKIEEIYTQTINKIKELEEKQRQITSEYIKKIEQEKISELKKLLNNEA